MKYLRQRRAKPVNVAPDSVTERRIAEMEQERCDTCTMLYPASMITVEDGVRKCPNDVDYWTAERKAQVEAADAAWIGSHQDRPQLYPPRSERFVSVTGLFDVDGNRIYTGHPVAVPANDLTPTTVVVRGVNLSADDTASIVYPDITVTAAVNSSTQVTLSVSIDGGFAPGDYNLTYNDYVFRGVIRVR